MKKIFLLILTVSLLISCKKQNSSSKLYDLPEFPEINFGQGGGITGKYELYALDVYGNIRKKNSQKIVHILSEGEKLNLNSLLLRSSEHLPFKRPGNYSYMLEFPQSRSLQYIWGEANYSPPPVIKELYDFLWEAVKS